MQNAINPMGDLIAAYTAPEAIQGRLSFSRLHVAIPALEAEYEGALVNDFAKL